MNIHSSTYCQKTKDSIWNVLEISLIIPHNQKETLPYIEVTKIGANVSFGINFSRKASLSADFHPGTLHGYFFH